MKRFLFFIMLALLPTMIMAQVARGEIKRPKNVNQRTAATKIPTVKKGVEETKFRIICPDSNHPHMIDLALPSGTLWACCNVGASRPDDFGHYFAWGETKKKSDYSLGTYQYGNDKYHLMNIGSDIAGTKYDAATANWGAPWRTPTNTQCNELIDNTTSQWTTYNGMSGRAFSSKKNGHTVFFPAAGYFLANELFNIGSNGYIWTSSIFKDNQNEARCLGFFSEYAYPFSGLRFCGHSIRPVCKN